MKIKRIIGLMLLMPLALQAQWSNSPATNTPVCTDPGNQYLPKMVSDQADGVFIVWEDYREENYCQLFLSHIDAEGNRTWDSDGILLTPQPFNPQSIQIANNEIGGVYIACIESGEIPALFITSTTADGNPAWSEGPLRQEIPTLNMSNLNMLADGQGGIIISWTENLGEPMDNSLRALRISANRELRWDFPGVQLSSLSVDQYAFQIQPDGSGGGWAAFLWENSFNETHLMLQKVNASGEQQFGLPGLRIRSTSDYINNFLMIPDANQGLFLLWTEDYIVKAQRITPDGNVAWDSSGVTVCPTSLYQSYPEAILDEANGLFVVWSDSRNNEYGTYAQRIDANGQRLWPEDGVLLHQPDGFSGRVRLIPDLESGAIVSLNSYSPDEVSDIYAQRVNADGEVLWGANGIVVSNAPQNQEYFQMLPHEAHGAILVWEDYRNQNADIYAQLLNRQGFLGIDTLPPVPASAPVNLAQEGTAVPISATCEDNISGVARVTLHYRQGGSLSFIPQEMDSAGADYQATIPASQVTSQGIQYYIEAEDLAGNIAQSSLYSVQVETNGMTSAPTPAVSYQMFSLPLSVTDGSPVAVLEDNLGAYDIKKWRLFEWQNTENRYLEFSEEGFGSFEAGNGFWLITREAMTIDTGPGMSLDLSENHWITMSEGWSVVSNPFPFPVAWSDIEKYNVSNSIWEYTGSEYRAATFMEPWKGYFLFSYNPQRYYVKSQAFFKKIIKTQYLLHERFLFFKHIVHNHQ